MSRFPCCQLQFHQSLGHNASLSFGPGLVKNPTRKEGKNSRKHISSAPLARSIGSQAFYGLCVWAWQAGAECVGGMVPSPSMATCLAIDC